MKVDIRVPEAGESITQVELARWLVEDGQYVDKDQEITEIDSDKATLTINAEAAGTISFLMEEGTTTEPGKIIGRIDTTAQKQDASPKKEPAEEKEPEAKPEDKSESKPGDHGPVSKGKEAKQSPDFTITPQAQKLMDDQDIQLDWDNIRPDGKRITKKDILAAIAGTPEAKQDTARELTSPALPSWGGNRDASRQKMSTLRKKIAERLVAVKNQTAMLTTFNEVDMTAIMSLRTRHQKAFTEKYGFKLGFMSFFVKAVAESIPFYPQVNGSIDGNQIVIPNYADVGIAVSTPKGLMVPVVRNAESMTLPQLEEAINELATKARDNKITIDELTGGTISITNGGVFGSMLSTPIINPPQSAILGMHNIVERPVAIDGQVEIRPMMYLALSYDHRVIDGKESVSFLVKVKEFIENPTRLLFQGKDPGEVILGL